MSNIQQNDDKLILSNSKPKESDYMQSVMSALTEQRRQSKENDGVTENKMNLGSISSSNAFALKKNDQDEVEADEEDNSQEQYSSEEQKQGTKPAHLNILKYDQSQPDDDLQSPSIRQNQEDSSDNNSDTDAPQMITRDLSPLSPQKKLRHLGQSKDSENGGYRPRNYSNANESQDFENFASERDPYSQKMQDISGAFKLKGTVDISTAHQVTQQSLNRVTDLITGSNENLKGTVVKKEVNAIPANPILPKQINATQKKPPQCPLKDIQFVQLKKFLRFKDQQLCKMGEGFDQIGKKNMMRENREKRRKYEDQLREEAARKGRENEDQAKMDEYTHIIQNIIYARDPKIFDTKNGFVNQRAAFMHENMLDIKSLIRMNEDRNGDRERFGHRQPPPKKYIKTKQEIERDKELETKARYQLKTHENGDIDRRDKTLLFESKFESGNLYLAQKVSDVEYNLLMQNDINTNGHTQWFYYQVKNTRKNLNVTFKIMNFTKPDSLFNYGMKVSIYSEKRAENEDLGWHKGGERISYYGNGIKKDITYTSKGYYTASFQHTFKHDDDTVYFAYCFPYTYTDMMNDVYEIEKDAERRKICTRKTMCKTLAGVDCEILTVTEKGDFEVMQKKKAVVISARVHPGEVVGSWMMRGVLFFITDPDNEEARMLREKFIFKIIPMLNPDGVINGNYRCSLAGCDLNRRWKTPHQRLHPTIYHTKKLIIDLHKERGVILYCDLHGHSRKQNVFMYGCNNKIKPEECRVFPLILSKLSKYFHFGSCRFGVQKSKESTARVSLYKELKSCPNIFTMESTFSGVDFGDEKGAHMTTASFESMGYDLCRVLLIYENIYIPPELRHLYGKQESGTDNPPDMSALFEQELQENKKLIAAGEGDSSGGSDSEPSEDNLPVEQVAKVVPIVDDKQKKQLQKIIKKREREAKEEEKQKKEPKKKPEESPARSPIPGQRGKSPTKKTQEIITVKPVEEKKAEPANKKKPEMKDAQTQTDRSDYQRIKKQQQQARMMAEMKDQQARLRQQAQQQLKSGTLVETNQMRKQPQSQTAQRDHITPSNYHNFGVTPYQPKTNNQYQIPPERHLQDMRDNPQKYQFSKDKQQLYQTPQKMPFQNQSIIQSPKNHDGTNRGSLQGGNHLVLKPNMIPGNQSSPGQSHIVYQKYDKNQSGQNKNVVINMSQINTVNSGLIAPNSNINHQGALQGLQQMNPIQSQQMKYGIPTINRNMNPQMLQQQSPSPGGMNPNFQGRNLPPNQTQNHSLPGSVIKKGNDGINILDIVDRNANPQNPQNQQQNLRGAGSTISKAGEQILQKQSNFKSPKKSNTQNIQQSNQMKSKQHELRFQIQSITSNALGGAIQQKGYSQGNDQKQPVMTNQVIIGGPPGINNINHQGAVGMRGNATRPVNSQNQYGSATRNTEQSQPGGQVSSQKQYPPNQEQTRRESVRRRADNQSQIERDQQNSRNKSEMKNIQLFKSPNNNSKTSNNPTQQNAINIQQAIVPNNQLSDSTKITTQSFDKRQKTNSISFQQSLPENGGVMSPVQRKPIINNQEKANTVGRIAMQNPTSLTNSPRNKDSAPKQLGGGQQQAGIQILNIGMNANQQNARNSSMQRSQNMTGGHRQVNTNMATGEQVRQNAMSHHVAGGLITMSQNSDHSINHKKHASQIIGNMQPQQQLYSAQAWNDPQRSKRQSGGNYMNSQQSAQALNTAALNSVPSQPADPTLNLSNSTPVSQNQTGGKRPKNASHNIYRMKLKSNQDTEDI